MLKVEQKLETLVARGKLDEDDSEIAYGLLMRLNFTCTNYPLLKRAVRMLGPAVE